MTDDLIPVVLERSGGVDSDVMSLRQAIVELEKAGHPDLTIGGHDHKRPASVTSGAVDDDHFQFLVCK